MAYPATLNNTVVSHASGQSITSTDENAQSVDINALGVKVGIGASTPTYGLVLTGGATSGTSSWAAGPLFNVRTYGAVGDGVTDDTAAIQAALNAAIAVRGTCYLPPTPTNSFYQVTPQANGNCLTWEGDYTTLEGAGHYGAAPIRCLATNFSGAIIAMGTTSGTVRVGNTIKNLHILGDQAAAYGGGGGMGLNLNASLLNMEHVRIEAVNGTGVSINALAGISFDNLLNDVYVFRLGADTADGFALSGQVLNTEFVSCKVNGSARAGGTTKGGRYGFNIPTGCGQIKLYNCHPYLVKTHGLYAGTMQDLIIIGGEYENNGTASSNNGIRLDGTTRFLINGAITYGNFYSAIFLNLCANGAIIGLDDFGSATQVTSIYLNASSKVRVIGCPSLIGSSLTRFAIENGACDYNHFIGNDGTMGAPLTVGAHSRVSGNNGVNPRGLITAPAIPASTVAYTNALGYDCMVNIVGGTVTNVTLAGTATGLTGGWFRVPAGQTIAITYSVVPTSWQWFGD